MICSYYVSACSISQQPTDKDVSDSLFSSRDSALRATGLACKSLSFYHEALLQNVSVDLNTFPSFLLALDNKNLGKLVKSIRCLKSRPLTETVFEKVQEEINEMFKPNSKSEDHPQQTMKKKKSSKKVKKDSKTDLDLQKDITNVTKGFVNGVVKEIQSHEDRLSAKAQAMYREALNLEELILNCVHLQPGFQQEIDGRMVPLPCFRHSLKRLFIPFFNAVKTNKDLSGRNVLWLLTFCECLEECSLGFAISVYDSKYLAEYASTFDSLSKVRKLSLDFRFDCDTTDPNTWWKVTEQDDGGFGHQKTETITNLLRATNKLKCLELQKSHDSHSSPGDERNEMWSVNNLCLKALSNSFISLEHLRLFDIIPSRSLESFDYSNLQNLKVLSGNGSLVTELLYVKPSLPSSLETFIFAYYMASRDEAVSEEDLFLAEVLRDRMGSSLPLLRLKKVVIPEFPFDSRGVLALPTSQRPLWTKRRKELESQEFFTSGRIELSKVRPGEAGE